MDRAFWQKQTTEQPLFADLLWSRPENRTQAGKLLIIGGNSHEFAAPASAYAAAVKAGAGTVRVLLPDSLQKTVGKLFPEAEFAPSTPIGSFGQESLASWLAAADWADGVLIAGDLGRNSETAILIEQFAQKYSGQLTFTKDAVNYVVSGPSSLLKRPNTLLVLSLSQLQKLARQARFTTAFTLSMDFLHLVDALHEFSQQFPLAIITKHLENLAVAVGGQVSTTKLVADQPIWRVEKAAAASTWWLQNPTQGFASLTTSMIAEL
ncbi:MAG TPA: hypothetical protein VHB51_03850 [Candidatus Saccharimonadales bacterium]|nr:hypothetical protein [Candidatus Saccharimonadales bacterium]